jgi:hypothetical protein
VLTDSNRDPAAALQQLLYQQTIKDDLTAVIA